MSKQIKIAVIGCPTNNGVNIINIIIKDIIYGIGIGISISDNYKFGEGYKRFIGKLKKLLYYGRTKIII